MHCTAQIGGSARGWALKVQVLAKVSLPFCFSQESFWPLLLDLIFFCWCRPSCCCRENCCCWAYWAQTMQGWHCHNFVSTKESNIHTFHKRPLCVFPLPCHWPQVMTFGKNENASNIKRLFPEFSGDGGVERSNVLGLRGFHSNRTSLWSGHLLPLQGFFQVTF